MKKSIIVTIAAILACVFILGGCGGQKQTSKLEAIKKAGKIVMYTNPEFPPYEFVEGNEVVGVDVEIGKRIAEKIGVELEIVSAEFGGIVASIASGKGDMAITGLTITEERAETVDFTIPYVNSIQYIIIPEDSSIEFFEDLAGMRIGGQLGTTGAMFVEDEMSGGVLVDTGAELLTYNSAPSAMQDLVSGRIDAVVIDELVAIAIAAENPGYEAIPFKYESGEPVREYFGACIAKGNEDLLNVMNEVIDELVKGGKIEEYLKMFEE